MTALHALASRVEHPSPLRRSVPAWQLILGVFAAPIAWLIQLLISYALEGDACPEAAAVASGGSSADTVAALAFGIVALAAAIAGLWSAHRTWSLAREEGPGDHHAALTSGLGRTRFLGLCGMVASSIFLAAILFEMLVPFTVSACVPP